MADDLVPSPADLANLYDAISGMLDAIDPPPVDFKGRFLAVFALGRLAVRLRGNTSSVSGWPETAVLHNTLSRLRTLRPDVTCPEATLSADAQEVLVSDTIAQKRQLRKAKRLLGSLMEWAAKTEPAEGDGGDGTTKLKKPRRGRKPDTDAVQDAQIVDAWKTGRYPKYEDLAREMRLTAYQVGCAVDRHRHRRNSGKRRKKSD